MDWTDQCEQREERRKQGKRKRERKDGGQDTRRELVDQESNRSCSQNGRGHIGIRKARGREVGSEAGKVACRGQDMQIRNDSVKVTCD